MDWKKEYLISTASVLQFLIHDSLKNLCYIIQEQLCMEMKVFLSQIITGLEEEALDGLPSKAKSHALSEIMKQGRYQL